jgi:hypothetical protein
MALSRRHRRAHDLASHATQAGFAHQALHRAAGHVCSLTLQLPPRLVGPLDLQVHLPDPLDVDAQHVIALDTDTAQCRVALLRSGRQ